MAAPLPVIGSGEWGPALNAVLQELQDQAAAAGSTSGATRKAVALAQAGLTGGGTILFSAASGLSWSDRLIVMSAGKGSHLSTTGFADIYMPPNGTVIPVVNGGSSVTVAGGAIPLSAWNSLYYIMPVGVAGTFAPGNFCLYSYGGGDFVVPDNWILIASHNAEYDYVRMQNGALLRKAIPWTVAAPEGDTGLRDISAMAFNGVTGAVKIQRVGREVTMTVANLTVPTSGRWLTLPAGWAPLNGNVGSFGVLREYVATGGYYVLQPLPDGFSTATQLTTGAGSAVASSRLQGQVKWATDVTWPALPYIGTPA